MAKLEPTEDIRPLSDFRSNAAAFVERVRNTRRPVILTQRGRSAAVLMDVAEAVSPARRVVWLPLAVQRVTQIAQHIARDGPGVASQWAEPPFHRSRRSAWAVVDFGDRDTAWARGFFAALGRFKRRGLRQLLGGDQDPDRAREAVRRLRPQNRGSFTTEPSARGE